MLEEWRSVVGYEGLYEVSSLGRVRSLDRYEQVNGGVRKRKGRVLKPGKNKDGYHRHVLSKDSVPGYVIVHQLVAKHFIVNPNNYPIVLHGPNGNQDNSVGNLYWGDYSQNAIDRQRDGTDHLVNRTECPRGHPLEEPNLRTSGPHRNCLACAKTHSYIKSRPNHSFQELSDIAYRRIIGEDILMPPAVKKPEPTKCSRGHSLAHPNLIRYELEKKNKKRCKACARTSDTLRRLSGDFQSISDEHYARIMKEENE